MKSKYINQVWSVKNQVLTKFNHETLNYGYMVGLILFSVSFDDTEESIGYDAQVITYHHDSFNGIWFLLFSAWNVCYLWGKKIIFAIL